MSAKDLINCFNAVSAALSAKSKQHKQVELQCAIRERACALAELRVRVFRNTAKLPTRIVISEEFHDFLDPCDVREEIVVDRSLKGKVCYAS